MVFHYEDYKSQKNPPNCNHKAFLEHILPLSSPMKPPKGQSGGSAGLRAVANSPLTITRFIPHRFSIIVVHFTEPLWSRHWSNPAGPEYRGHNAASSMASIGINGSISLDVLLRLPL